MTTEASVTFVGTATTVLDIGGFTLLTDPNLRHVNARRCGDGTARGLPLGGRPR